MNNIADGPQPMTHAAREALAAEIAEKLKTHFGEALIAIGIYGSLARGTDGPYSDIEIWCVVEGEEVEEYIEWTTGPWKAEIDVVSEDEILRDAAEVDGDWAMTHGAFVRIQPVFDPHNFFPRVRETARSQPDEVFEKNIHGVIVGEIYEMVGKIRNIRVSGETGMLPFFAVQLALYGAWLLGLAHRHLYSTTAKMFTESLTLPDRPKGYDALCKMVMAGNLSGPDQIFRVADQFWAGIAAWTEVRGIKTEQALNDLLLER